MNEQILENFLLGKIEVKVFVDKVFEGQNRQDGNFTITRSQLSQLCDLRIQREISNDFLMNISDHLMVSDYFVWDSDSADGEVVSETIFEWGNPEINYEINDLNLRLWKEYLQTGEYKLGEYNNWNSHIKQQKDVCKKAGSEWRPVNPKHKIGVSGNLFAEPIHGLRHVPEKGTAGWYIWTGEYSTANDFFKPIHAEHLLQTRPDVIKYLGLQPGFRFLIDNKGHEDIWEDSQFLNSDE